MRYQDIEWDDVRGICERSQGHTWYPEVMQDFSYIIQSDGVHAKVTSD